MKKRFTSIFLIAATVILCACGNSGNNPQNSGPAEISDETSSETDAGKQEGETKNTDSSANLTMTDPGGAEITVPEQVNSIVVLTPSLTEIVTALGLGDKITACDSYSADVEGVPDGIPTFSDITNPDMEQLAALSPDILLISNETLYDQESPFQSLIDTGTCVIRVPNRDTIAGIKSDIEFLADALDASEAGKTLVEDFDTQLKELADIAAKIPQEEHRRVYFEIAPAPNMYSCGSGSFINEMIEWIGAENILADQEGWFTVEGETIVSANPDFIFTNANYMEDPVQEILDRDGWADISAVADKNVYSIDSDSSSHSNHTIVKAMRQMAEILYPDYYTEK